MASETPSWRIISIHDNYSVFTKSFIHFLIWQLAYDVPDVTWKRHDPSGPLAIKARTPTPQRVGGGSKGLTPLEINKHHHFSTHGLFSTWNLCRKEWGCSLKKKNFSGSKAPLINVSFKLKGSKKGGHGTNVGNKSLPLLSEGQSLNGRVSVFTQLISCVMDLEKRFPLGLSANLRLAFCFLKMTLRWLLYHSNWL